MALPPIDPALLFTVLGIGLLALGAGRCLRERRLAPPGSIWLTVGAVFTLMSVWLHVNALRG